MARYIDADKLIAHLEDEIEGCKPPFNSRANGKSIAYGTVLGLKSAISFAKTLPPADVVPKSEVEALKDDNKFLQDRRFKEWSEVRQVVAREIFEEIDLIHKKVFVDVAKMNLGDLEKTVLYEYFKLIDGCTNTLKKKYTESEKDNGD